MEPITALSLSLRYLVFADREANKLLRSFDIGPESSASTPAPSPCGNSG